MSVLKVWRKSVHIWWSYFTKHAFFKFPKFHLYMHLSIVELACDNQFSKLSDECDRSYWTKCCYKFSNHINHIFWHHGCAGHCESCGNDGSHAYVYSKIKLDILLFLIWTRFQMCSFGMSIGFLPLIRIILKVWRKSVHIWWSYFTKRAIFKFPKFHLYMHLSIVELACDNQFLKLSHGCDRSYWTKCCYKLSNHIKLYILTSRLCQASQVARKWQVTCLCLLKN